MTSRLEFAIETAYAAGRQTLALFQNLPSYDLKENMTPVTQADIEAERYIRTQIEKKYPGETIYGEEEGSTGNSDKRWVIDPIDGTKSFICGVPIYATLLSFEQEGVPVVGVAYFPALDWMMYAEQGSGAYSNGRIARVSQERNLEKSVLCSAGHKSMLKYGRSAGLDKLATKALATRTWSDAYGHCLVASGRVEAMIDPILEPYDISAVDLIVREAGGAFTDFEGRHAPRNQAVSSNGLLHETVLEAFRP